MTKPQIRYLLVLVVLASAMLACNLPVSGPVPPPSPEPLGTGDAGQLAEQIQQTLESALPAGEVTITITEQQLHSFVVQQMANQQDELISEPQVVLTNGQMEIYGKVNQGGLSLNSRIVVSPSIDAAGEPRLEIISMNLGPIQVTDALKDRVQDLVDSMLSDYLMENAGRNFRITSITIVDKTLTVTGVPQ